MDTRSDESSESLSPRIVCRASFIFEYSDEVQDFVALIGDTFRRNSEAILRLDFSTDHLDVHCAHDSRFVLIQLVELEPLNKKFQKVEKS